jgi:hypothetical protein
MRKVFYILFLMIFMIISLPVAIFPPQLFISISCFGPVNASQAWQQPWGVRIDSLRHRAFIADQPRGVVYVMDLSGVTHTSARLFY